MSAHLPSLEVLRKIAFASFAWPPKLFETFVLAQARHRVQLCANLLCCGRSSRLLFVTLIFGALLGMLFYFLSLGRNRAAETVLESVQNQGKMLPEVTSARHGAPLVPRMCLGLSRPPFWDLF